jgi:hypothetical protein
MNVNIEEKIFYHIHILFICRDLEVVMDKLVTQDRPDLEVQVEKMDFQDYQVHEVKTEFKALEEDPVFLAHQDRREMMDLREKRAKWVFKVC